MPERLDALMEAEGVDRALLFCEYSPRATGVQPIEDFPDVHFVFAHGGRGWWYDTAAFLALAKPNVWLDLAGLPPKRLPEYYARFGLSRLAERWIFGTDWPGVPGAARAGR
ncbi:amidohydrolase family protein [Spirillospora sp. CA-255316]